MNNSPYLHVYNVFSEAWRKVSGMKSSFWGAVALVVLVGAGGLGILTTILILGKIAFTPNLVTLCNADPTFFLSPRFIIPVGMLGTFLVYHIAQTLLEMIVLLPMRMGVRLIALRRAANKSVNALFVFKFFTWKYIIRFIILEMFIVLIIGLPAGIGSALLWIPTIDHFTLTGKIISCAAASLFLLLALYLAVSYSFVNLIIIDRDIGAWHSMELSRKIVTKKWFRLFFTFILLVVVLAIGAALLLVGLIWAIPFAQNVIAILYRDLLGIEGKDPVTLKEAV